LWHRGHAEAIARLVRQVSKRLMTLSAEINIWWYSQVYRGLKSMAIAREMVAFLGRH